MAIDNSVQASPRVIQEYRAIAGTSGAIKSLHDSLPAYAKKYLTGERLSRIALNVFAKTPGLWKCEPRAIFRCLTECALLGLEPSAGGSMPMCYLIPMAKECTLMVAWQGWIATARRTGCVQQISARIVYASDLFGFSHGLEGLEFEHKPHLGDDKRGEVVGAYCLWKCDEVWEIRYMSRVDLDKRKAASPAGERGPWKGWYEEMCLKTVIKSSAKWWPRSAEAVDAIANLEAIDDTGHIVDPKSHIVDATGPLQPPPSMSDALADSITTKSAARARPALLPRPADGSDEAQSVAAASVAEPGSDDDGDEYGAPEAGWDL